MRIDHVEAAVLAGGQSSRMGRDKARLELDGLPLIAHVVRTLEACVARVRIVLHDTAAEPPIDRAVLLDTHAVRAPIVGVATALAHAEAPWVLVSACDLPDVQPELVLALIALAPRESPYDVVVPEGARGPEPLLALYRPRLLPDLERRIEAGELSLQPVMDGDRVLRIPASDLRGVDPELRSLHNVNRPADLARAGSAS